jgi:pimeloyl-ACP methyl ester carboxylesterase
VSRLLTGLLAAALLFVGWSRIAALEPKREEGRLPTQPELPYFRYLPDAEPRDRVLVVPGLNSNKEFMQVFSAALADAGFDVYSIDLPGHGDSKVPFNAVTARQAVENALKLVGPNIAIGHSMGGAILLDLAGEFPLRAMVLISPAPTPVPDAPLPRTLATTGGFDIPAVNSFVSRTVSQLQGVEVREFKWGAHSSAPLNPIQTREIVHWLGGDMNRLRTGARMFWLGLMFAGGILLGIVLLPHRPKQPGHTLMSAKAVVLTYVAACSIAIVVLHFVMVVRWVRLFTADYMVSFWFVAGIALVAFASSRKRIAVRFPIFFGLAAAGYVIVVLGLFTGSHLIHMTLSDGRWWRFPVIAAASFPLFLFDEIAIRPFAKVWRTAALGILTRLLLTAAIATGILTLNRESGFFVLLTGMMLMFWVTLWFATEIVSRRIQNPLASALFAALVQGWMFAAWFVTV